MKRFVLLLICLALICVSCPAPVLANGVAQLQENSGQLASNTTITAKVCAVSPCSMTTGSVQTVFVSWNSSANLTIPIGWTNACATNPCATNTGVTTKIVALYRITQSGDQGTVALTFDASTAISYIYYEHFGEDQTTSVEGVVANTQNNTTAISVTSGTATATNDYPLAVIAERQSSIAPALGSGWTQDDFQNNGSIFEEAQHGPTLSSGTATASATYSAAVYAASVIVLIRPSTVSLYNGLSLTGAGGPHVSSVVGGGGGNTPFDAKMVSYADTGGSAMVPTTAQAAKWFNYMQDVGSFNGNAETICASPCELVHYMDIWKAEVTPSGNDSSFPYHSSNGNYNGTCPGSTGANFFTAGIDSENWYLHATGTSSSIGNRIASIDTIPSTHTYIWMMNPGSTTLQTFVRSTVANCYWNNIGGGGHLYSWSKHRGFIDNTKWRISIGWSEWGPDEYNTQTNVGTYQTGGPPYAAGTACTTTALLYPGTTLCTTSTQTTTNGTSTLEYGSNDAQYIADMNTLLSGMLKNAVDGGGCEGVFFNGYFAADDSILKNSCVIGGVAEKVNVDGCSHGSQGQMESELDGLALANNSYPSKRNVIEDTASGNSTDPCAVGHAEHEMAKRMHYAPVWVGGYENIVDQPYLDSGVSLANYVFPATYLVPQWSSAYQTMAVPAPLPCGEPGFPSNAIFGGAGQQCTSGGAHDAALCHGTFPNCFYVREFAHCSYNANFDNTTPGVDKGPCAVGWNLTSGSVAESTFSGYFAHWANYGHVIAFCSPNASYITAGGTFSTGTTVVCSSGGGDVANGGSMDFTTLAKSSFTGSLAQYDAIFLVQ